MKSYRMKFMAILLALLMCVCLVDTHALVADETNGPVYESGDLTYTFTLQGSWNSGYNASIRIDNHSAQPIEDWRFEMEYAGSISNIWNAVIESNADGKYIIKNAGWNQDIAAGSYVEFGLSGAEAFDKYPSSYTMLTGIAANSSEDFTAVFEITNDWTQGFTGRITITNNTDAVIEDWVLEFDGENEISTLWDGQIVSHEGTHYIVKSADYNQNIPVGGSVSFNFNVDFRTSDAEFTNFALSSYADLSQQTNPGGDIQEPGGFDDIGEAYFKEPTAADIVVDDELGIRYVRNQLLVSAFMGLEKSVMEDICEEIGATIVGYIALSNDFQIEFSDDMTIEDLEIMADYLNSYSFVSNVTLNMSYELQEDITTTNDTLYNDGDVWSETNPSGDTWALGTLKVLSAWDQKASFAPVKIGVFDGGFDTTHWDLRFAAVENCSTERARIAHGTHVAGIMAAIHNNNTGIAGVASNDVSQNNVQLYAYGSGTSGEGSDMGDKMAYAKLIGNHVKVINVSLGLQDEVAYAASHPELVGTDNSDNAKEYVNGRAAVQTEFFKKMIASGYDFVICCSAGNTNDNYFIKSTGTGSKYGIRKATKDEINDSNITKLSPGGVDAQYNSVLTAITDDVVKERIIVVGSIKKDSNYTLSDFSDIGTRVDVVAPGESILSTVQHDYKASMYDKMTGTSMASPHVAGIVALMFQANPSMKGYKVKQFLKESASSYSTGNASYPIPDAAKCVDYAQNFSTFVTNDVSWPSGTLTGETIYNTGKLANVSFSAFRTSSGDYNVGTYSAGKYSFSFESDSDGEFVTVLPQGVYDITVYKEGYLPFCIKNVIINPDETTYLGSVALTWWNSNPRAKYTIQGVVKNAITGDLESDVSVKLRKGWNNQSGGYITNITGTVRSTTTDTNGRFTFSLSAGSYTAEISKDGFVTGYYNVICTDKNSVEYHDHDYEYAMVISPVLDDDEYRLVLTWGSSPSDLDSQLTYYVNDVKTKHVYYSSPTASYDGNVLAQLDLDDTSSYGPETVTITFNADLVKDGNFFRYSVHDFSNKSSTDSKALSMSGAVVHLYKGNTLWNTYFIPTNEVGTVWHVLTIDESGIHTVHEFYNEDSAYDVK